VGSRRRRVDWRSAGGATALSCVLRSATECL